MLNLSKYSILIVEKNTLLCGVLIDVFGSVGVPTMLSTADPEIAFDRFKAFPVDIVVSDWSPDLDGRAFLKRLRTDPDSPNPFVPVIISTANTKHRRDFTAWDLGKTEYLTKPVSGKVIYSRIVAMIGHDRPFIKAAGFVGPDRRRHGHESSFGNGRRKAFND
ncbi:MAG: response regulator [Proteobacteria bacterium]|nr:response regulator [Pseudomonadota bacterium]